MAKVSIFASALLATTRVAYAFLGTATFNNYDNQPSVACPSEMKGDANGIYAAAISDYSPLNDGHYCYYTPLQQAQDRSVCTRVAADTYQPPTDYAGPACPQYLCGSCFKVTNSQNQKAITVKIVDKCPKLSPWNYCKNVTISTNQPFPDIGKCASSENHLDISEGARAALGAGFDNLRTIDIVQTSCTPGGSTQGVTSYT